MTAQAHPYPTQPLLRRTAAVAQSPSARYASGILLLAAAYYGSAKIGQTLRYTASVTAMWLPAGVGIAALYLWGLRLWPGVLLGELLVNGELLDNGTLPLGSVIGQQAGNMAEIVVGALLLRRLIGRRAALDRAEQVGRMLGALAIATAVSATVGTSAMLFGGVIDASAALPFWRTWWLGDTAGALVMVPLALAWIPDPDAVRRRICTWQGALMIAAVTGLGYVFLAYTYWFSVPFAGVTTAAACFVAAAVLVYF